MSSMLKFVLEGFRIMMMRQAALFFCLIALSASSLVYDASMGKLAGVHSSIAYANMKDIMAWSNFGSETCSTMTKGFALNATYVNEATQAHAYVGVDTDNELIVLSFRGSENIVNWIEDIRTSKNYKTECSVEGMPLGNIHHGFCTYYNSLTPNILAGRVNDLAVLHPTYTVFITGHSLGAATAAIAGAHIGLLYPNVNPVVYTVGEPRAGDISFVKKFDESGSTSFRIVHRHDPVAHLSVCCDFCAADATCPYHQGTQIFYRSEDMDDLTGGSGAKYTTCGQYEDRNCADMPIPPSVNDHLTYFNVRVASFCKGTDQ